MSIEAQETAARSTLRSRVRRTVLVVMSSVVVAGLVLPMAHAHDPIAGSGLSNGGSWTHYTNTRSTEAADQGIRVDDLPGRPMDIYIRNPNTDVRLGDERRYTSEEEWGWFSEDWGLSLGTPFVISAKKDQDYWWGQTTWSGIIHF